MLRDLASSFGQFTPSLNLDFSKGVLPVGVSYSRSGVATRVNSSGLIETVAANVPRFNFDPVTLACRGIQFEPTVTNLFAQSTNPLSGWGGQGYTVVQNAAIAPDGTQTAIKMRESAVDQTHFAAAIGAFGSSGKYYTHSVYAKAGERTEFEINSSLGNGIYATVRYNLSNGLVTYQSGATGRMAPAGNGWYRCSWTHNTVAGSGNFDLSIRPVGPNSSYAYQGDGTSGFFLWQRDFTEGRITTMPIITTTNTVTRNRSWCTLPVGPWYRAGGTFVIGFDREFSGRPDAIGLNHCDLFRMTDGSTEGSYVENAAFNTWLSFTQKYGTGGYMGISGPNSYPAKNKIAFRTGKNMAYALNGQLCGTSTYPTDPSPTGIVLGDYDGNRPWFGTIEYVRFYPNYLSNALLTAYSV
nr:hypothetical protein [uncultured Arsenicibacter sp.]